MIGIIGGIGPHAGLELHRNILELSDAKSDQDHLPIIHINIASQIPDRTQYLLGNIDENPAISLSAQVMDAYSAGSRIIGLPCNTAHADPIFNEIIIRLQLCRGLLLVNMIDELFFNIINNGVRKVGLLATMGSYQCKLFETYTEKYGVEVVPPEYEIQKAIHKTIYNKKDGLKATGRLNHRIKTQYESIINQYQEKNIHSVILGCTEISMVFPSEYYKGIHTFCSMRILAKSLVREYKNYNQRQSQSKSTAT
jgi:aspartate racemase